MIRSINHSSKDYVLCISGISWKKNYQNLFDYDERSNDNLISFNFQLMLNHSFFLVTRDKKTLELKVEHRKELRKIDDKDIGQGTQLVCAGKMSIKQRVFMLKLYQPDQVIKQTQQNPNFYPQHHIVVRSIKNQQKQPIGYQIKSNNILKLGNCQFFIHLVHNQCLPSPANSFSKEKSQLSQFMSIDEIKFFINNNQKVYDAGLEENFPEAQCKYCMMPEEGEDFLCSPCKCSGSCAMVHFGCLVKWNKHKVKKSQGKGCVQYNFEKFFCQVCKQEYPQYIKKHKKVYEIMPVQKPKGSHVVLEALSSLKRHVIIIENIGSEGLVLGRGQQCNLKLDGPTISRRHAVIMQEESQFRIFDLKSKFGTLIRDISMVFPLRKDQKFSIQSGRSVISFELQKKSTQKLFQ